jgi:hypothetical protein
MARNGPAPPKSRLVSDPVRGSVVTQIFGWRVNSKLSIPAITARLKSGTENLSDTPEIADQPPATTPAAGSMSGALEPTAAEADMEAIRAAAEQRAAAEARAAVAEQRTAEADQWRTEADAAAEEMAAQLSAAQARADQAEAAHAAAQVRKHRTRTATDHRSDDPALISVATASISRRRYTSRCQASAMMGLRSFPGAGRVPVVAVMHECAVVRHIGEDSGSGECLCTIGAFIKSPSAPDSVRRLPIEATFPL